jgi:hypothetical protein
LTGEEDKLSTFDELRLQLLLLMLLMLDEYIDDDGEADKRVGGKLETIDEVFGIGLGLGLGLGLWPGWNVLKVNWGTTHKGRRCWL